MWGIANAATESLTVDSALNSPEKLIDLAGEINKVPRKRIAFVTMQTRDDKLNGVWQTLITKPGATDLFKRLATDQPLTASGKPASPTASATAVPASAITVAVQNGTSVGGRAGTIKQALLDRGFSKRSTSSNGTPAATTSLTYHAGQLSRAKTVAKALGLPASALKQGSGGGIVLLIGSDWRTARASPAATRPRCRSTPDLAASW